MALLEEALISYLCGYSALTALVGQRIFPFCIPQKEQLPCVTFQRVDTPHLLYHSSSGASGDPIIPRVQFDCWATSQLEAQQISMVLQGALHGKKGSIGTSPYSKTIGPTLMEGAGYPMREPEVNLWRWVTEYVIRLIE